MNRLCPLLMILLAAFSCSKSGDESAILKAEAKLTLPSNAYPLSRYDRYYAINGRTAKGIFITSTAKGKLVLVKETKDLPFVADGGCSVVQVQLDLGSGDWQHVFCHGL